MRRGRVFLYLSLILILLIAGGYLVYTNFFKPEGPATVTVEEVEPDTVDIVVITQRTPRGTILDETVMGTIPLPRDLVIAGMFTDLNQVVGRQAKFDLDSGIPLTVNMLVDSAAQLSTDGSVASLSIPEGMVAKSIPISRLASVSYALRPGDRVVVIASMKFIDLDSDFQSALPNNTALVLGSNISLSTEGGPTRLTSEITEAAGPFGRTEIDEDLADESVGAHPLKLWHTENLSEEFTLKKAEEVKSFADYQELERRLFGQMDELIYDHTDAGPEKALVRYSSGSASDPRARTPDWNRSHELTTEHPLGGVLLLHGMSDSPYSLRTLGESLNRPGYWVIALRLPGHGTIPSGLNCPMTAYR